MPRCTLASKMFGSLNTALKIQNLQFLNPNHSQIDKISYVCDFFKADTIETINKTTIEKEQVLYYIEAKKDRIKASYSTQKIFDKNEVEILQNKAIAFTNKVKEIIESFNLW